MFLYLQRLFNHRCLNRGHQSLRGKPLLAKSFLTHRVSGGNGFGEVVNRIERTCAGLGNRAQRFFEDGRDAACLVADRGVVVEVATAPGSVFLPPGDPVDEFLCDLR